MKDDKDILIPFLISLSVAIIINFTGNYFLQLAQAIYCFASQYLPFINTPQPQFHLDILKYTVIGILVSPSTLAQIFVEIYSLFTGILQPNLLEKTCALTFSFISLINIYVSIKSPESSVRFSLIIGILYVITLFIIYIVNNIIFIFDSIALILLSVM
ncbi:hypothetical protein [Desulforamulus profundi]|uniref:hypothetical protein n=1 Tax=Desulforamulus profundi TaxID=1383067 RepID=UPI001177E951|nr:hypothetical protein [Desulforamulus profundi]